MTTPWITPSSRERPTAPTHAHQVGVFEREEAAASHSLDSAAGPPCGGGAASVGEAQYLGAQGASGAGQARYAVLDWCNRPPASLPGQLADVGGRAKTASTCFTTSTPAQLRFAKSPLPSLSSGAPLGPPRVPPVPIRRMQVHSLSLCACPMPLAPCHLPLRLMVPQPHSLRDPSTAFGCASSRQGEEARRTLNVACARRIVST